MSLTQKHLKISLQLGSWNFCDKMCPYKGRHTLLQSSSTGLGSRAVQMFYHCLLFFFLTSALTDEDNLSLVSFPYKSRRSSWVLGSTRNPTTCVHALSRLVMTMHCLSLSWHCASVGMCVSGLVNGSAESFQKDGWLQRKLLFLSTAGCISLLLLLHIDFCLFTSQSFPLSHCLNTNFISS